VAPHQAHIAVGLVHEEVELVALEHHLEVGAEAILLAASSISVAATLLDLGMAVRFAHVIGQFAVHRSVTSSMRCRKLTLKPAAFIVARVIAQKPSVR
jgi:hypothetical protein